MIINKPVADAVGSGVDVNSAKGVMVVNIGADTTEISVMSLGVLSSAVPLSSVEISLTNRL